MSLTVTPSTSDMDSLTGVRKILYDLFVPITFWPQKLLAMAQPDIDKIAGNSADNSADNIDDNSTVLPFITFKKAGDLIPNSEICLNPERASI